MAKITEVNNSSAESKSKGKSKPHSSFLHRPAPTKAPTALLIEDVQEQSRSTREVAEMVSRLDGNLKNDAENSGGILNGRKLVKMAFKIFDHLVNLLVSILMSAIMISFQARSFIIQGYKFLSIANLYILESFIFAVVVNVKLVYGVTGWIAAWINVPYNPVEKQPGSLDNGLTKKGDKTNGVGQGLIKSEGRKLSFGVINALFWGGLDYSPTMTNVNNKAKIYSTTETVDNKFNLLKLENKNTNILGISDSKDPRLDVSENKQATTILRKSKNSGDSVSSGLSKKQRTRMGRLIHRRPRTRKRVFSRNSGNVPTLKYANSTLTATQKYQLWNTLRNMDSKKTSIAWNSGKIARGNVGTLFNSHASPEINGALEFVKAGARNGKDADRQKQSAFSPITSTVRLSSDSYALSEKENI